MKLDSGLGGGDFNPHFINSFSTEKEMIDEYLKPLHDHLWPGLKKPERIKKFKLLYKLCKKAEV
jgi:hypothetical protein